MYNNDEEQHWMGVIERNRKLAGLQNKLQRLREEAIERADSYTPTEQASIRAGVRQDYLSSPDIRDLEESIKKLLIKPFIIVEHPDGEKQNVFIPDPPIHSTDLYA
tara:strand:+ start:505 stop:822 length:318 start_codon:yes stop_codon:yes gene_type:complete